MAPQPTSTPRRAPIQGFVLFTTPLRLNSADLDSSECPICREPYIDFQQPLLDPSNTEGEWAVRVDISAARDGGKRCCGHVFGRKCLERHVKGNEPWRSGCPICRAPWFTEEGNGISSSTAATSDTSTARSADPPSTAPSSRATTRDRASRLARSVLRRCEGRRRSGGRRENGRISSRGRDQTSALFIQQVLDAFGVEAGTEEIKASVEQVEETLERMYQELDEGSY